jgi:hypothetical protein
MWLPKFRFSSQYFLNSFFYFVVRFAGFFKGIFSGPMQTVHFDPFVPAHGQKIGRGLADSTPTSPTHTVCAPVLSNLDGLVMFC